MINNEKLLIHGKRLQHYEFDLGYGCLKHAETDFSPANKKSAPEIVGPNLHQGGPV